jgi:Co/Zn/Cd efflux system component
MKDLLENLARFPRYLITITLGVLYSAAMRFKPLTKKPLTLVALIGLSVSGVMFLIFTLQAMLGLTPVDW